MKVIRRTLIGLLAMAIMSGAVLAQTAETEDTQNFQDMITALDADIAELRFLSSIIGEANTREHDVLVYRQDERSFRLLTDFNNLVAQLPNLPDDSSQLVTARTQLSELGEIIGVAILKRIDKIRQRINLSTEQLDALSGGALIAAEASIQSMEDIHIKFYQALVSHLNSRAALGLPSENLHKVFEPNLYLFAEILTGRIQSIGAAKSEVQVRANQDPKNVDVAATLVTLDSHHKLNISRLQAIILVMDSLKLDSSDFKTVMLKQTGSFSVSFFSLDALTSVIEDSWEALKSAFVENTPDILFRLFLFILVLAVFRVLTRITRRVVSAASERSSLDMSALLKNILVSTSGGIVMGLGILMALSQVGISLAPMLAGLGVAGFIVGFALQDTLGNFAAGAMILIYRPFDVDDFVEVTGASGLVKKMNLVSTTITTFDNQTLVIPNNKIWGDVIKNVTAQRERRVDLEFGIGYDDDIELAERVLNEIVAAHEKILEHPEPNIKLHTLGDSSVNFIVRPWTKTEDYWDVYWDLMREVKLRFDREGISIPYPQRDVHLHTEKEN